MAIKANLTIEQGTSFSATIDVLNEQGNVFDLTGYTLASQMRKSYAVTTAITFGTSSAPLQGKIHLSLSPASSTTIEPGRYVYDVETVRHKFSRPRRIQTKRPTLLGFLEPQMIR